MRFHGWYLAAALPLLAACSHAKQAVKEEAPAPPPVAAAQPEAPAPAPVVAAAPAAPAEQACSADDQCSSKELCVSSKCVEITAGLAECRSAAAHFDFDRAVLHPSDLPGLRRAARCLTALPDERTLVAGNCDERGTVQYNVALGFRRAHAVAKYMEDMGVPTAQLSEVSYGKELPICKRASESCWATNRRTDVTPGAEAKDLTAMIRADERRERSAAAKATAAGRRTPAGRHAGAAGKPAATAPAPAK